MEHDLTVVLGPEAGGWCYRVCIGKDVIVSGWIKGSKSEARLHAIHDAKEALEEQRKVRV